jgi:hypothetical protein
MSDQSVDLLDCSASNFAGAALCDPTHDGQMLASIGPTPHSLTALLEVRRRLDYRSSPGLTGRADAMIARFRAPKENAYYGIVPYFSTLVEWAVE